MTPDHAASAPLPKNPEMVCAFPHLDHVAQRSRVFLLSEFLVLFLGVPLALFFGLTTSLPPLPILWTVAAYCLVVLLRDPGFDRRRLWNGAPLRRQIPLILALFAVAAAFGALLVRHYAPSLFLVLLLANPRLWALAMIGYPLFSVYPQGLIYRAFFFHRYRALWPAAPGAGSWILILVSGITFALMHIVFHNWIALALTLPGGILFAIRYAKTRSLAASSVEHALYGCFLFTVGLGQFFYVRVV